MLSTIPTIRSDKRSEVPPWLTKTSGVPESGKSESMDAILIKD
jgi:hypothetical protein